jgi:pyruvate dehydrogenase E1 component beta subunit
MGAAMTGLRPVAEIMFSDFFAVCWDIVVNQIAKDRYMTNGQVTLPLVVKTGNGGACASARSTRSRSRTGPWRSPASRW